MAVSTTRIGAVQTDKGGNRFDAARGSQHSRCESKSAEMTGNRHHCRSQRERGAKRDEDARSPRAESQALK